MLIANKHHRIASRTERVRIAASPSRPASRSLLPDLEVTPQATRAAEMLARARQGRNDREARRWLAERIGDAIAGLIPLAGVAGTLAEEARNYLRRLKTEGFDPVLRNHVQELAPAARAILWREVIEHGEELPPVFDVSTTPKWFARLCNKRRTRRPLGRGWLFPHRLPEIVLGKHRLNDAQKDCLLVALRHSSLARPHPLVNALCRYVEPASRDAFAWALFDQWDSRDQPPRGQWTLRALALFGGAASAVRLAHLLSVWLKDGRWRLARLGLECLHVMGTGGLLQLFHFAQTLPSPRWADMVRGWLAQAAEERRLSLPELRDWAVPALGLDEHGVRIFSYGRRCFRVRVGPCLRVSVVDDRGRRLAALPEPNRRDDLAAALPAFDDWFYFRKQLRQVRDFQGPALEQAMITGRRWLVEEFRGIFVHNAVMFQLARGLLWAGHTAQDRSRHLFRLNEDGAWVDEHDAVLAAKRIATVSLVHPLHLTEEQRQTWGEVFANDDLASPFPQLARPFAVLLSKEQNSDQIRRWDHLSFPALALLKVLKQLGWKRPEYGEQDCHFRAFAEANVMAIVRYSPGIPWEPFQGKEYQRQLHCYFVRGGPDGGSLPQIDRAMCLSQVDPVIVSEILCQLNVLAFKGE